MFNGSEKIELNRGSVLAADLFLDEDTTHRLAVENPTSGDMSTW